MTGIVPTTTGSIYTSNAAAPLLECARRKPDRVAYVYDGKSYSYADLIAQIDAAVDVLEDYGIRAGDRVAFIGPNHPSMLIMMYAMAQLGGVHIPLNPRCSAEEVKFITNDAEVAAVVAVSDFCALIDRVRSELPCDRFIGVGAAREGWRELSVLGVEGGKGVSKRALHPTESKDLAMMLYTSGTTGSPKGVMITHGNVWGHVSNLNLTCRFNEDATILAIAPMFHIGSLAYALSILSAGGRLVIRPGFDPDDVYAVFAEWQITLMFAVPTMLAALESHPRFPEEDFSRLSVVAAGAPVPPAILQTWLDRGAKIVQGYGMTEGGGTMLDAHMSLEKIGSAGVPLPMTEVEIRNIETNEPITEPNVDGQIMMRGAAMTPGYWRRPEETAKTIDAEGWLASGDIGRWDEDGYIYIVDRLKEMIISGGMNVYPAEVEKVMKNHAAIDSVAVVGLPHEHWGEQVTALVVLKEGEAVTEDDLEAYCKDMMSNYKVPQEYLFYDSLLIGPTGKVLKRKMREALLNA